MKVKVESEKVGLKLNIQKTKIMGMPANKYYTQFNNAVKLYINKSSDFDNIDSILDIDDVGLLTRILFSIENRFAYDKFAGRKPGLD